MDKRIILYITIIVFILAVVFFSQQSYSKDEINKILSFIAKGAGASLLNGFNPSNVAPDASHSTSSTSSTSKESASTNSTSNSSNISAYSTKNNTSGQLIDIPVISPIENYITKGLKAVSAVPGKIGETIKSGGEAITNSINSAKENISSAENKIGNYFSNVANSLAGNNNSNNCTTAPTN